jgi:hypothetical protein
VCAIGRGVEEEIRERITREMEWIVLFGREYQPRGRHAILFGKFAQAFFRIGRWVEKPKNTVGNAFQNLKPTLEGEAADFMRAVEAAEYERTIGQPGVASCRTFSRDHPLTIVGLVARKPNDFLRVIDLRSLWDDPIVRDDVVMIGSGHRPRITEPIHLHRCRVAGE